MCIEFQLYFVQKFIYSNLQDIVYRIYDSITKMTSIFVTFKIVFHSRKHVCQLSFSILTTDNVEFRYDGLH